MGQHPLKTWLDKNEMTQTRLAESVGITTGRVSQIIHGGKPSLDLMARIQAVTNDELKVEDFLPEQVEARQ